MTTSTITVVHCDFPGCDERAEQFDARTMPGGWTGRIYTHGCPEHGEAIAAHAATIESETIRRKDWWSLRCACGWTPPRRAAWSSSGLREHHREHLTAALTAEEATPDCVLPPTWGAKSGGEYDTRLPEELLMHLHNRDARYMPADPPAPLFTGDEALPHEPAWTDVTDMVANPGTATVEIARRQHDPDDERRADDAHMAAGEAWMEHDAEQGEARLDGEFADERGKFDPLIGEQGEGGAR